MRRLVQKLKRKGYRLLGTVVGARSHQRVQRAPLDPGISYPSYKPLDEFIDVERLQQLDGVLRTQILEQVWEYQFDPGTNLVDSCVRRLRQKVDDLRETPLIETVRGVGYRFREGD